MLTHWNQQGLDLHVVNVGATLIKDLVQQNHTIVLKDAHHPNCEDAAHISNLLRTFFYGASRRSAHGVGQRRQG